MSSTQYKPRISFSAMALVAVALIAITFVIFEWNHDRTKKADIIRGSIEVRLASLGGVYDRQLASGAIDPSSHNSDGARAYAGTAAIRWAERIPADHNVREDSITGGIAADNLNSFVTDQSIEQLMSTASLCGSPSVAMVPLADHTLAGCRLSNDDIFAALFNMPQMAARTERLVFSRWFSFFGLVIAAGIFAYLASRIVLHGPISRLNRALTGAEQDLTLKLDRPLPNNEIGWLGDRIANWLAQLKRTQSELERAALVADTTDSGMAIFGSNFKVEWVNSAFTEISGFLPEDVLGSSFKDLLRGEDASSRITAEVKAQIGSGNAVNFETLVHRKDGATFWVRADLHPVKDDSSEITSWVAVFDDVSARRETDEKLAEQVRDLEAAREQQNKLTAELEEARKTAESSNQFKSDFLANMSHEIRTPMNGVLGMADVLLTTGLSSSQRDYIQTIKESGSALLTILNDILDLSKLEAGKITLDKETTDLHRLVTSVTSLMLPKANEKGVQLTAEISHEVPTEILEDGGRLRQILLNLVGNAVKFTETGSIKVSVSINGQAGKAKYLNFSVTDTGAGIADEFKQSLFERFEQGGSGAEAGGTGLGLSICRELTWLMGGEIGLESTVGEGSTFTIEIPFIALKSGDTLKPSTGSIDLTSPTPQAPSSEAPQNEPAEDQVEEPAESASGLKILLAEDHPVNQSLMKAFIQKLGHTIEIAEDGVDAVKAIRTNHYDLILMDIQMPRMDGVMATKVIRSLETGKASTPIIAVTANAMTGQRDHYLQSGMDGYVSKPVQLDALQSEIERVWVAYQNQAEETRSAG